MDVATFRQWFPEFAAVPDTRVQFWIGRSTGHFDTARWGDLLEEGQANWVAHNLQNEQRQAADQAAFGGAEYGVIKRRAGDTEIQYSEAMLAGQSGAGGPYARTTYGQQYQLLLHIVGRGALAL